jgi:hypothetical protein
LTELENNITELNFLRYREAEKEEEEEEEDNEEEENERKEMEKRRNQEILEKKRIKKTERPKKETRNLRNLINNQKYEEEKEEFTNFYKELQNNNYLLKEKINEQDDIDDEMRKSISLFQLLELRNKSEIFQYENKVKKKLFIKIKKR